MTRPRRGPRGFALVIVAVCGVAMTAMALAVVFTAGSTRILSVKGASIDHSTAIADSGMERALAYAQATIRSELDFDALLDPGFATDCALTPNARAIGRPRYTDGTDVTDTDGTRYKRVAFNDGAYYTRFDDDADDVVAPTADLSSYTSNNPAAGACLEGAAFAPGNNPHRDRNRAVWITVIGVYPDAPLTTAKHRITLRRLFASPEPSPLAQMLVTGDVNVDSSSVFTYCSSRGPMVVGGALSINPSATFGHTGSVAVNSTVSGTASNPTCGAGTWPARGALTASAGVSVPPPITPLLHSGWVDASSSCIFRVDTRGVFFWHGAGTRQGGAITCATSNPLTTLLPGPFAPSPITLNDARGATCWLPLVLQSGGTAFPGVSTDEVCSSTSWCPEANDTTQENGTSAAFSAGTNTWNGVQFSAALPKPNFGACTAYGGQFRPGAASTSCAPNCNGANNVITFSGGTPQFTNNYSAYPTGVYSMGSPTGTNLGSLMSTVPASEAPASWPQITLAISGNARLDGGKTMAIGVGTTPSDTSNPTNGRVRYPSMLVSGDLVVDNASLYLAGSLVVGGTLTVTNSGRLEVHGQVVAAQLDLASNANMRVLHDDDFGTVRQEPVIAFPTTGKTLR